MENIDRQHNAMHALRQVDLLSYFFFPQRLLMTRICRSVLRACRKSRSPRLVIRYSCIIDENRLVHVSQARINVMRPAIGSSTNRTVLPGFLCGDRCLSPALIWMKRSRVRATRGWYFIGLFAGFSIIFFPSISTLINNLYTIKSRKNIFLKRDKLRRLLWRRTFVFLITHS